MRAIIDAPPPVSGLPVRLCVKSLFLPSESFFPRADNFRFQKPFRFGWSHQLPEEPSASNLEDHPKSTEEDRTSSITQLNAAAADERAFRGGSLAEDPQNAEISFNLREPEPKEQLQLYQKTIVEFFKSCKNLREICIAQGIGWKTERMKYWIYVVTNYALPVVASRVKKMRIMVPQLRRAYIPVISDYFFIEPEEGERKVFSRSLKSLDITIHSMQEFRIPGNKDTIIKNQIAKFFPNVPNIESFGIAMTDLTRTPSPQIFSPLSAGAHLTSLNFCTIFISDTVTNHSSFEDFKTMIVSVPYLKSLEMKCIVLYHPYRAYDPDTDLPAPKPEAMLPSWGSELLPPINWATIFELLRKRLLHLTSYSFRHLMYGGGFVCPRKHRGGKVMLVVPTDQRYKMLKGEDSIDLLRADELISPYPRDYTELEALKQEVCNRRKVVGLGGGG
ncbi:hypothetical protein TWF506_011280 [Arthrobotrys conoides]|uniref:Uncharacterized protein n=1 Tax=Arthrobotrys conoides TaxID=74498 RepID=A0AAN8N0X0_9PEZI